MVKPTRHIASINDLSKTEITGIFDLAQTYLDTLHDPILPYRVARSCDAASGAVLATLFYEPSTRTRLSFESAMLRMGGRVISSADSGASSAAKGESLADTVRVVSNYADVIVVRHPRDGAARLAADYCSVPVINGGDGSHEHPTQTLCDLFTLNKRNSSFKNLNVAISGDLRGSRTIHSLVYALARFGANIILMPAKGLELPSHVFNRLRDEMHCRMTPAQSENGHASIDALYVTANAPHQLSLIPEGVDIHVRMTSRVDAVYVTRFQKERSGGKIENTYPTVNAEFLSDAKYSNASVMHPLPRVGELDQSMDTDKRATYFEQAAYGVPIRMALISALLGLQNNHLLKSYDGGFPSSKALSIDQHLDAGIQCQNANCIVHDTLEQPYVRSKFSLISSVPERSKLRCVYCETDIEHFVVGNVETRKFTANVAQINAATSRQLKQFVFFKDDQAALARDYRSGDPLNAGR
jgi:aspartate carbamoyltransferase catalytic subunit